MTTGAHTRRCERWGSIWKLLIPNVAVGNEMIPMGMSPLPRRARKTAGSGTLASASESSFGFFSVSRAAPTALQLEVSL